MMTKALIVKDDYVVFSNSVPMIYEDSSFTMDAILMNFIQAQKSDIIYGSLFCNEAPSFIVAQAIVAAELSKVVYQESELNDDQKKAIDLMEQYSIVVVNNSNIIL